MMASTMVPIQRIVKMVSFYIGIEFFVLHALRCHYPKYHRLFNVLEWLLLDIPTDRDDNTLTVVEHTVTTRDTEIPIKRQVASDTKSTMVFLASKNFTQKLLHSDNKKTKADRKQVEKLLKTNEPNGKVQR
jgi:hypothetical protein